MKQELEMKLADEFTFMRRDTSTDIQNLIEKPELLGNLYEAFGCECDDGWYELIREFCVAVTEKYQQFGMPVDIVIHQLKEKYGTLQVYYDYNSEQYGVVVGNLRNEIQQLVEAYELKSEAVCERCGKDGILRDDLSWMQVLCDECNGIC